MRVLLAISMVRTISPAPELIDKRYLQAGIYPGLTLVISSW